MKQFRLKNVHFLTNEAVGHISLYSWLLSQKLHGKQSRSRSRFMKYLEERVDEVSKERLALAKEYADLDAEGKPVMLDMEGKVTKDENVKGGFSYQINEKKDAFTKAIEELLQEEFVMDITPEKSEVFDTVKEVVLSTLDTFEGKMAVAYDDWCTAFEQTPEAPKA